jgi:hypothetical protein
VPMSHIQVLNNEHGGSKRASLSNATTIHIADRESGHYQAGMVGKKISPVGESYTGIVGVVGGVDEFTFRDIGPESLDTSVRFEKKNQSVENWLLTTSKSAWEGGQSQGTLSLYKRKSRPPSHRPFSSRLFPATTPIWGICRGSISSLSLGVKLGDRVTRIGVADAKKTVAAERRRATVWNNLEVMCVFVRERVKWKGNDSQRRIYVYKAT